MNGRVRAAAAALAIVAATLGTGGAAVTGVEPVDCDAPNLDAIETQITIARVNAIAGHREGVRAAIEAAREQLDAIAETCWGEVASPGPSLPPVMLGGSGTIGGRVLAFPADLVVLDDGLLRPVDEDDLHADALTLADSSVAAEVIDSDLEEPVPPGFRVISLAVGDAPAALTTLGLTDPEVEIPGDPVQALALLVEAIADGEAETDGESSIDFDEVRAFAFPDGMAGASVDFEGIGDDRVVLVAGSFLVRPLPDGDWALGVALAAPSGVDRLRAELVATLLSIGPVS